MTEPPNMKTAAAELQLDGDQNGNHLGGNAVTKTNDANNAQHAWQRDAEIILAARAATGEPFSAEDLRADGLGEPDKPARWGILFRLAAGEGLIVSVGVVNSRRAQRHGSLSRVWVGAHGEGIAA